MPQMLSIELNLYWTENVPLTLRSEHIDMAASSYSWYPCVEISRKPGLLDKLDKIPTWSTLIWFYRNNLFSPWTSSLYFLSFCTCASLLKSKNMKSSCQNNFYGLIVLDKRAVDLQTLQSDRCLIEAYNWCSSS